MSLGAGTESAFVTDVAFWVIAGSTIIAALAVVQIRDIFRAAMALVVSLLGVAGLFVLLRAEFLAVVQVLIYVGAISVLIIFAVLMTRDVEHGSPSNRLWVPAFVVALLFLVSAAYVAVNTEWELLDEAILQTSAVGGEVLADDTVGDVQGVYSNTVPVIAGLLLRDFVLAFEVASVLLLAAMIGALTLVRER